MSRWSNYHVHSRFDDGKGEPEEYARAALAAGLVSLGFSNHNVVPFPTDWTMPEENLPLYLAAVRDLQACYRGRLPIFLGMEVDFIPGVTDARSPRILTLGLQYTLGSVHFLGQFADGRYWMVDYTPQMYDQGMRECYGGNVRRMVEEYYRRVGLMALTAPTDIVGHFDVIKLNNRGDRHFSEDDPWYRSAAGGALEAVARAGCILEASTASVFRKKLTALYPADWILRECLRLGIPITLNSDAHAPDQLTGHYPQAIAHLRELGFRTQRQLTESGWVDIALE